MKYLLDSCLLSELVKPSPEPAVLSWLHERIERELFISAMTLAELFRGVARLPSSRRRNELSTWLQQLETGFEDRVREFKFLQVGGILKTSIIKKELSSIA